MHYRHDELDTHSQLARERDARQQLLRAQEVGKVGSWEADLERNTLTWSDMVFRIFEIEREEFGGTEDAFFELVHPEDRSAFLQARENWLIKGGAFVYEHRIVTPGGSVKWVVERAQIISSESGTPLITTGTVQDVTDLREAQAARAQLEHELSRNMRLVRVAGEIGHIGGWRYELGADCVEWTEETARLHDLPPGATPTVQAALSFYAEEDQKRIENLFHECVSKGESFDDIFGLITASGRKITVRSIGNAERDEQGQIIAINGAFQDISDIIALQRRSDETQDQLNRTQEAISDAFLLLDRSWHVVYLNRKAEALLQRPRETLLGAEVWEEFPEAVGGQFDTLYRRAVLTRESIEFEEYFAPLESWFRVTAHPTDEGLAVYFRDVTTERHRNQELRLLNAAVSRINDILLITEAEPAEDPDGPRIVYVNEAFERRTGYSSEEVMGKTPRILQGPKTQRSELDRIRTALEDWKPVRAELINYTKEGVEFWLELDIVPLADDNGRYTHWVAIERDISERKQAEQKVRSNEERFRLMAKAARTTIWEWDVVNNSLWWSEGLEEIFGHHPPPDVKAAGAWKALIHPGDLDRISALLKRLLSGEQEIMQEQHRFQRADGSWAKVEANAFSLRSEEGEVLRLIGSMTDVSERLELERQLQQTQKLVSIGEMTGGIAHDFNNILTVIMGNSELLTDELTNPETRQLANQVTVAAQRGAELTHRLLAFARRQVLTPQVIDLNAVAQSMLVMLRRSLGEDVEIKISFAPDLRLVEIDPAQLESALLNLAINARDAMPSGGALTIETQNTWIDADAAEVVDITEGHYAAIAVSDSGDGISGKDIDRVIEPFFTTKDNGTGLGLPMVFGFVKQSGGHLKIYSEPGTGTTIRLYFPAAAADAIETSRDTATARMPNGDSELVLVVEDDPFVRRNSVAMIRSLNYTVIEAENAEAALELLGQHDDISLLFTDVVMPGGMNGSELAEIAARRRPGLRVLFTSGYTQNAFYHNGSLDHGIDLLSKPYRRHELAMKLRLVLDRPAVDT